MFCSFEAAANIISDPTSSSTILLSKLKIQNKNSEHSLGSDVVKGPLEFEMDMIRLP
jgi:hypothetical protein